ncbi:HDOD domain-containing protein [Campylobacter sp. CX2-8023-23]|uniref:HDOD domain-containing protein n=1 Tax=Campylobacter porcelli TaxID=1660073 RepID=UPI002E9EA1F0|nr:HDOD domain-containing protein [Campylobacter sp. CX2-8023-23]
MNESIYKSIKSLPPLDETIIKIQKICSNDDSDIAELISVIHQDPMLTANILRSANSPLYGFSREINDVDRAVALFGMATIRGFALAGTINKNFKIDLSPYKINETNFMDIATKQNALAFNWCNQIDRELLNIISPASFMMDIGKIIIAKELIESNKADKFKSQIQSISTPIELYNLEIDMVGISSQMVTAQIFKNWNLEPEISNAIRYLLNPSDAPDNVKKHCIILNIISNSINIFGTLSQSQIDSSKELLDFYNLDVKSYLDAIEKVRN